MYASWLKKPVPHIISPGTGIQNDCMLAETGQQRRKYTLKRKYIGTNNRRRASEPICCLVCLKGEPPVVNTRITNKKRRLCAQHYREFRQENSCSFGECPRIIKNEKTRLCAFHDHGESKECKTKGCGEKRNRRYNLCNKCYMREYRQKKRKEQRKHTEVDLHQGEEKRYIFNGGFSLFPKELGLSEDKDDSTRMMSMYVIKRFAGGTAVT